MPEAAGLGSVLVALIVAGLSAGFVVFYRGRSRAAETAAGHADAIAHAAEAAQTASPAGCFAFSHPDGGPRCTASLAAMLGLRESAAADFRALLDCLKPGDAGQLSAQVDALQPNGSGLRMQVAHRDGTKSYDVHGHLVALGPDQPPVAHLWFYEVSGLIHDLDRARGERDRQSTLLDSLPIPIWQRDAEAALIYCNAAYSDAVGRPREEVLAEAVELPGRALAAASRELALRALAAGGPACESHHVVVAGERRFLEICEQPLSAEPGRLVGWADDRTQVEEIEGELARHVAAHAEVLETLASAIAIFGPDMRLKFFNSAYPRLWKLDESTLEGEPHLTDIYEMLRERRRLPEHPDFPGFKKEQVRRFSTMIEPVEELLHVPDGSTVRMTVTPHPFGGILFTYEDVTDRLALERNYNTLIAVQRETLDNLYEGVAVYGADGQLKLFNPAFATIWQLDGEFLAGEPHVRDVLGQTRSLFGRDEATWPALLEQLVVSTTEPHADSGRYERSDGSVVDWAQVPLPDGASLFTYLDVTDEIRVERALRERNEALETADRLKSEFLANVSYELRTPLNAIMGFAEILENQFFGELNERQSEYSRAIVESSQRLLALINDILDLATIEAGYLRLDLRAVRVLDLLQSIETLAHERARSRDLRIALDCPDDVGTIVADERRIKQAVFNLVSNSFKFTPGGGSVVMRARRSADEVELSVVDTGVGLDPQDQERVFGKFERGTGQGRQTGAGLGLSLVKSLIDLHGGWVELQSVPHKGTTVTCHLPLNPAVPPANDQAPADAG